MSLKHPEFDVQPDSKSIAIAILMMVLSWLLLVAFFITICCAVSAFADDPSLRYNNIANLNFYTSNTDHGSPAAVGLGIVQTQYYLATGQDIPLSQKYLRIKVGRESFTDIINVPHGFSSPALTQAKCYQYGSCPEVMWKRPITPEMDAAAIHAGPAFFTYTDVPTYAAAKAHLAVNPGDGVMISTDGYDAYGFIGLDSQQRGILVHYYGTNGYADVLHLDDAAGDALWRQMTEDNDHSPANYVFGFVMP